MSDFQAGPAPQQPHQPQPPQYQQQYQAPAPPQGPPVPHIAAPRYGLLTSSRRHWFFALITAAVLLLWYVGFRVLLRNGALSGNLYLPYIWTTNTIFLVGGYFFGAAIATAFVLRVIALSNGSLQHNHYLSSRSFLYGFSALIFLGTDFIFRYLLSAWMMDTSFGIRYLELQYWLESFNTWVITPLTFATLTGFFVARSLNAYTRSFRGHAAPQYPGAY